MMVLDQKRAVLGGIWWYWVSMRQYWLVLGDTGGHYNMVLCGIKWYWVNKGLLCLYILKKINGDVNRPTDLQGEYRAICLFRKLENRKKAEICKDKSMSSQDSRQN